MDLHVGENHLCVQRSAMVHVHFFGRNATDADPYYEELTSYEPTMITAPSTMGCKYQPIIEWQQVGDCNTTMTIHNCHLRAQLPQFGKGDHELWLQKIALQCWFRFHLVPSQRVVAWVNPCPLSIHLITHSYIFVSKDLVVRLGSPGYQQSLVDTEWGNVYTGSQHFSTW